MAILADQIMGLLKEGIMLWRTYLDKRLEHYNLHLKKKRMNALKIADRMDELVDEVFRFVDTKVAMRDEGWKDYYNLKKKYNSLDKKFDKLS
jgi:hypothetical protein